MEDKRKLAHIEAIKSLSPIEGADLIEVAEVLGWQCVVKKGEFKVGDLVVYVEVDSVMPEKPEYEFLRNRKFRVKTIKLKGQISQGLVLPLGKIHGFVGDDVTDILGIKKYLTPSELKEEEKAIIEASKLKRFMMRYSWFRRLVLSKTKKSSFPHWVSKTDEERIQNMPNVLNQFSDKIVYVTEKIDYQSVTFTGKMISSNVPIIGKFLPKKYQFVVCSRNMTNTNKNSLYWNIAKKYNIEQILKDNPTLTIQGEQGDTKVQGNKYGITEPTLWVFNIIDHEKNYHYNYVEMYNFCIRNGLTVVPKISEGCLKNYGSTVQELVEFSQGKSVLANIPREGIVVRCIENGKKVFSFKVINPKFLLKYED